MRSPTITLLQQIWWRHRGTIGAIAALTVAGHVGATDGAPEESSPALVLLALLAFLLLFGVFSATESSDGRAFGRFPERLFTLPVTTLRLVAIPMLAGIAAVELLYLAWIGPLFGGGTASAWFVGVLLASLFVFHLWALWTLERAGSMRLVVLGLLATAIFVIAILPSFPPTPAPAWRSESALGACVVLLAVAAFLLAWRHVAELRSGGGGRDRTESLWGAIAEAMPARSRRFASAAAAHFWYEWRSSGMVLPALVGGVIVLVIVPMSWAARDDAGETFRLLVATLAMPVVLAVPVGAAFAKPTFWSDDVSLPPFVAVRPLSACDLVATKLRVAAASAALAWVLVLGFVAVWLPSWADLDVVRSVAVWPALAAAALVLTWRFLVNRLWSGLSGRRPLFFASVLSLVVIVFGGLALDAGGVVAWALETPRRVDAMVWVLSAALAAKVVIAGFAWRRVTARPLRGYLAVWSITTATLVGLVLAVWELARPAVPPDPSRVRSLVVLIALLAVPLARVGLAPSSLESNRHR